jgi:hypothetical protein
MGETQRHPIRGALQFDHFRVSAKDSFEFELWLLFQRELLP